MKQILLVGNPNCGKTTIFNALTGEHQRVGNWPGVTVEQKTGQYHFENIPVSITDLPGIYSVTTSQQGSSEDEKIASQALVSYPFDIIVNIIDACHLERHLYLTSQLLELNKPLIIVLNMMDIAATRGIHINVEQLSKIFNCPILPLQAHKKIGLTLLQKTINGPLSIATSLPLALDDTVQNAVQRLTKELQSLYGVAPEKSYYYAQRCLEGDDMLLPQVHFSESYVDYDIHLADARYQKIHAYIELIQKKQSDASEHLTAKIDRIVLHRYFALPIFFLIMYVMFLFAINIGGAFQDFFDKSTDALFVQGVAYVLQLVHAPQWTIALLANGVGVGINTTLTFIPVIAAMYFFLALLESSGYMARAAFVVDKIMRLLGLPGKAFVPMIVGFGCNVPAIMAARTLDCERDRILTVIMSPFMSCSARLAIYAIFVAAFFPQGGQNVVFSLYLIGVIVAVLTGWLLKKTALSGQSAPLIIELPAYHRPKLARLFKEMLFRLHYFIIRAGRMIIPVCVLLGGLNAIHVSNSWQYATVSPSVLSLVGQYLTPLFAPMGLHTHNWPATVGLLTGMLAKEVVVGTLNSLYAQASDIAQLGATHFDLIAQLKEALWSIPNNLSHIVDALFNPIVASVPDNSVSQSVYGIMAERFDGKAGAYAYLLFVLLYIPCVSTMAAIRQETERKWMWFSIAWSFTIAYAAAVIFYQAAFFASHPQRAIFWISLMLAFIGLFVFNLYTQILGKNNVAVSS